MKTSSSNRPIDPHRTWGPTEVYAAAGVHRGVAHSWIARQLVPLPPGPGMGKERQFSFLDAMCVAVIVELTRLGLTVGAASHAVNTLIEAENRSAAEQALQGDGMWTLLIEPSSNPGGIESAGSSSVSFFQDRNPEERDQRIRAKYPDAVSFVRLDFSALARRMKANLGPVDATLKKDRLKNA